ncbi:MAG: hypothetical protein IMY67_09120 [Bacteroidetes bacterium]|nr:hypothetical protein [Bacteroidota bacterium]
MSIFIFIWAMFVAYSFSNANEASNFIYLSILMVLIFPFSKNNIFLTFFLLLAIIASFFVANWWTALINIPLTAAISSGLLLLFNTKTRPPEESE